MVNSNNVSIVMGDVGVDIVNNGKMNLEGELCKQHERIFFKVSFRNYCLKPCIRKKCLTLMEKLT